MKIKGPFIASGIVYMSILLNCVHLKEARNAYVQEHYALAVLLCKEAVAKDSLDVEAFILMAKSYDALDSLALAMNASNRVAQTAPETPGIEALRCRILKKMGDRAYEEGDHRTALERYGSAEAICPTDTSIKRRIADLYFEQGRLSHARKKYAEMAENLADSSTISQRLQEIDRRSGEAGGLYQRGLNALGKSQFGAAESHFSKALQIQADFEDARYYQLIAMGRRHYKRGSKSALWDAIEAFGKAVVIRENSAEPHVWLARSYEKKEEYEFTNAIDEYEIALQLEPNGEFTGECKKKLDELKSRKKKLDEFWGKKKNP